MAWRGAFRFGTAVFLVAHSGHVAHQFLMSLQCSGQPLQLTQHFVTPQVSACSYVVQLPQDVVSGYEVRPVAGEYTILHNHLVHGPPTNDITQIDETTFPL